MRSRGTSQRATVEHPKQSNEVGHNDLQVLTLEVDRVNALEIDHILVLMAEHAEEEPVLHILDADVVELVPLELRIRTEFMLYVLAQSIHLWKFDATFDIIDVLAKDRNRVSMATAPLALTTALRCSKCMGATSFWWDG